MNKLLFLALILSFVVIELHACSFKACKKKNQHNCQIFDGYSYYNDYNLYSCLTLDGGPFLSGKADGDYDCTIYSEGSCTGRTSTVSRSGKNFSFKPKSAKCYCHVTCK